MIKLKRVIEKEYELFLHDVEEGKWVEATEQDLNLCFYEKYSEVLNERFDLQSRLDSLAEEADKEREKVKALQEELSLTKKLLEEAKLSKVYVPYSPPTYVPYDPFNPYPGVYKDVITCDTTNVQDYTCQTMNQTTCCDSNICRSVESEHNVLSDKEMKDILEEMENQRLRSYYL